MEIELNVLPDSGEDDGDVALWAGLLRDEAAELDGAVIEIMDGLVPSGAKGVGKVAGLVAHVPHGVVKALITVVRAWVVRTGRTVEVNLDGDTIKISGASRELQDQVIEAWLVRHSSGS